MAKRKEHHVVHNKDGGWDVRRENAQRSSVHAETKKEAEDKGRQISQRQKTELVTHNKDGKISGSDSHGNDPNPPKDKK